MVTRRSSDTGTPAVAVAPVFKRKRRASCLGEQERRERKRAIDREAQRSLREKTKSHIAELERTIQILRDQDRNSTTASLLSEIETLRAENERLRDVIENVKNIVRCGDVPVKTAVWNGRSANNMMVVEEADDRSTGEDGHQLSPIASSPGTLDHFAKRIERLTHHPLTGRPSPELPGQRQPSLGPSNLPSQSLHQQQQPDIKPTPQSLPSPPHISYTSPKLPAAPPPPKRVDLDGMTVMTDLVSTNISSTEISPANHHHINHTANATGNENLVTSSDDKHSYNHNLMYDVTASAPQSPTPAAWIPFIAEIWGRCPSPTVIHLGERSTMGYGREGKLSASESPFSS